MKFVDWKQPFRLIDIFQYVALILLAIIYGWLFTPWLIRWVITNKMVLSPEINPEFYQAWEYPPVPIYLKVYLFNVTNPEEIEAGKKPRFSEIGPYVFEEHRTKYNIYLDDEADTATYTQRISYHFRPNLSHNFTLADKVTLINVPFAGAAIRVQNEVPWMFRHMVHMILRNYKEPLFIIKTADEVLFQGWKVPFLDQIEEETGLSFVPNNTVGYFYGQNNTEKGPFIIRRGLKEDKHMFGSTTHYENREKMNVWTKTPKRCNEIMGSDGSIFPSYLDKNSTLNLFSGDICASLQYTYKEETSFKGIAGLRFTDSLRLFEDSRTSDENQCYCPEFSSEPEKCLAKGALDLGPCRDNAPVAMSTVHFLDADPMYLNNVEDGFSPNRDLHESFIDVEPRTGLAFRLKSSAQFNLILKRARNIPSLANVKEMLFPLFWATEMATIDQKGSERLKEVLLLLDLVDIISKWGTLGITVGLVFLVNYLKWSKSKKEKCLHNIILKPAKDQLKAHAGIKVNSENMLLMTEESAIKK